MAEFCEQFTNFKTTSVAANISDKNVFKKDILKEDTFRSEIENSCDNEALISGEKSTLLTDAPLVDISALKDLECKAFEVDRNLNQVMENICKSLKGISMASVDYAECYKDCIRNVGNCSETACKTMAKLIGKCEEMNCSMEPLYGMAEQLKLVNVLLNQLEEKCKY